MPHVRDQFRSGQSRVKLNRAPAIAVTKRVHGVGQHRRHFRGLAAEAEHHSGFHRRYSAFQMRSEEHTSELQSLMRISYAVFCLKKKKKHESVTEKYTNHNNINTNKHHFSQNTSIHSCNTSQIRSISTQHAQMTYTN